jgi:hypothetical protein
MVCAAAAGVAGTTEQAASTSAARRICGLLIEAPCPDLQSTETT